jgi:pilus assembly protein TadC
VTPTWAAPAAATLGSVLAVAAFGARERPLVAELRSDPRPDGQGALHRVGRSALVRALVSASRIEAAAANAGVPIDVSALAGGAAIVAGAALLLALAVGERGALLAPVLAAVVLRVPVFATANAAARRTRAVERDVPLLLDVLSLASYAGLPAPAALQRAVAVIDGPLADELSRALQDVELGARWRERLGELADRLEAPDLRRTIAVLRRSESIGSGTAEPVTVLADEVRAARRASISERARKAPVQMLFPLVFLVLPAFLLLTVVPVLVATLGSIR